MGDGLYPFVPVLVHKVVNDTAGSLGEVRVGIGGRLAELDLLDVGQSLLIGGIEVVGDTALDIRDLSAVAPVGAHRPELCSPTLTREVADASPLLDPSG